MSYTPDAKGMLAPEYVDVYGIPFSLIPFKGKPKDDSGKDPVYHHIFALDDRAELEIRVPVVESYTYDVTGCGLPRDVDGFEGLVVNEEPTQVYLAPPRGYQDEAASPVVTDFVTQTREEFYGTVRFQQVIFRLAQLIVDDLVQGEQGQGADGVARALRAKHQIFPEVVRILQEYVDKKVTFAPGIDRRELAIQKYVTLARERVREGILAAVAPTETQLLPIVNSFRPWISTADVNYRTTRPVVRLTKSHLNLAAFHSDWERDAIGILEDLDCVDAFTPNDRQVGLAIPYEYSEAQYHYEPDFVVRVRGGRLVVLEIKGKAGEIHDEDRVLAKNAAARKWVAAVNNAQRYGRWVFEICRELDRLRDTLEHHSEGSRAVPFRYVVAGPDERFRTCVPLVSLRVAAGRWSEEQMNLDELGEWATDWVSIGTGRHFEPGMFVAKVQGDSMEPEIQDGSYCLFRQPRGGSRQGRKLLVWHSGISDPESGGQFTLKVYTSEKTVDPNEGWAHTRIVLKPLNPKCEPIVLTPTDEGEVRVVGEFVEVVR